MPKERNFIKSALIVALLDFVFCLVAGLVIFSFIFGYGATPDGGLGLVFISLPLIFAKWSDYRFFVFCRPYFCWHYFSCLYARTTPIHGLLIVFAFLAPKQTFLLLALRMAWVCYCCLVIQQAINETLSFFGKTLFKWFGYISASYMLPLAGVFLCAFVGWILPKSQVYAMCEGYLRTIAFEIWYFVIRFIVPLGILAAMIQSAIKDM